jgi:hypothetical protein
MILSDTFIRFSVNAYQQTYPAFPELIEEEKSTSNFQCQTDSMMLAAVGGNFESRNKLQKALESIAESEVDRAEIIAMEQREMVLKMLAEDEAANEAKQKEEPKPESPKHSRPLHLPRSNFDMAEKSKIDDQSTKDYQETIQNLRDLVEQRDSVARLYNMLHQERSEVVEPKDSGRSKEAGASASTRKLPKRIYDCPREPPKILPPPSDSLISLAERLRHLDVNSAGSELAGVSLFEHDSEFVSTSLHHKLKQLPVSEQPRNSQTAAIGSITSLHNRLRKLSDI